MSSMKEMDAFNIPTDTVPTSREEREKLRAEETRKRSEEGIRFANATDIHFSDGDMERIAQAREEAYRTKQDVSTIVTVFGLNGFSEEIQLYVLSDFFKKTCFSSRLYQLEKAKKFTAFRDCFALKAKIKHAIKENCIGFQLTFQGNDPDFRGFFEAVNKLKQAVDGIQQMTSSMTKSDEITRFINDWITVKVQEIQERNKVDEDALLHDPFDYPFKMLGFDLAASAGNVTIHNLTLSALHKELRLFSEKDWEDYHEKLIYISKKDGDHAMQLLNEVCSGQRELSSMSWNELCTFIKIFENFGYVLDNSPGDIFDDNFEGVKQLYGITEYPKEMEELYNCVSSAIFADEIKEDQLRAAAKRWKFGSTGSIPNEEDDEDDEDDEAEAAMLKAEWRKTFGDREMDIAAAIEQLEEL